MSFCGRELHTLRNCEIQYAGRLESSQTVGKPRRVDTEPLAKGLGHPRAPRGCQHDSDRGSIASRVGHGYPGENLFLVISLSGFGGWSLRVFIFLLQTCCSGENNPVDSFWPFSPMIMKPKHASFPTRLAASELTPSQE